jgi:hypothetical protein
MACFQLRVLERSNDSICLFNALNPRTTALVDDHGRRVLPFNGIDCPGDFAPPLLACTPTCRFIPTSGAWGLVITALVLLIAAKMAFSVFRQPALARK